MRIAVPLLLMCADLLNDQSVVLHLPLHCPPTTISRPLPTVTPVRFRCLVPYSLRHLVPLLLLTWLTSWSPRLAAQDVAELRVIPDRVTLESPEATEQILIVARIANGDVVDVTRTATRETASSSIVALSPSGRLSPLNDGEARLSFNYQGKTAELIVTVSNLASPQPVSFRRDIVPVLTKSGCNSGACHGKAEGQNGFKLSVFGYDAVADHDAIVHEGRGRRVFAADPDQSLFLRSGGRDSSRWRTETYR